MYISRFSRCANANLFFYNCIIKFFIIIIFISYVRGFFMLGIVLVAVILKLAAPDQKARLSQGSSGHVQNLPNSQRDFFIF